MEFAETLWLWNDDTIRTMLRQAVVFNVDHTAPHSRKVYEMREALEMELAKRVALGMPDSVVDAPGFERWKALRDKARGNAPR